MPSATPTTRDPGHPMEPDTPRALEAVAAATFGALSRLRGARSFHPRGVGYAGVLRVEGPGGRGEAERRGVPLLEGPAEHRALVRFSRGAGLPEPLPDILGIALRLPDVHGPGLHQDFLLASSASGPVLQHLLVPGTSFFGRPCSSLLAYRFAGRLRVVGAMAPARAEGRGAGALPTLEEAAERGTANFDLAVAPLGGGWAPVARLELAERLPDKETEELAFTPWNSGGGILPVGPLMGVRQSAYRGSQRGRGLQPRQIP